MEDQVLIGEIGCFYCYDNKKRKEKEPLWFMDAANNLKLCDYCPKCGRKYGEVIVYEQLDEPKSKLGIDTV